MYSLDWPYAYEIPKSTALFKQNPDDFKVDEYFEGQFSGEGEHLLIKIEKKGLNTEEVIKALGRVVNKPTKLISYAGLKDRHALTTQWISIHAPGEEIQGISEWQGSGWRVLESTRHHKKLRPGYLTGNHFQITLHDVSDIEDVIQRIEKIKRIGVPNYFGEQRFGRACGNLEKADSVLTQGKRVKDRFLQGLYYSAARSWLYNLILAKRVSEFTWNTPLEGDVFQLSGSNSIFTVENIDDEIIRRVKAHDISPASPLAGKSKEIVTGVPLKIINDVFSQWQPWVIGLDKQGLVEAWRANILTVSNLHYETQENSIKLSFTLPGGTYATTVLREIARYDYV